MPTLLFGVTPILLGSSGTAAPASPSSSTTEVNFASVKVSAGLLGLNGRIQVDALYKFVGVTATKRNVVRLSTTSGDTSAGFAFLNRTASSAALSSQQEGRSFWNTNSASAQACMDPTASGTGESGITISTGAINTANDAWININGFVTNAADTIQLLGYTVWLIPGV